MVRNLDSSDEDQDRDAVETRFLAESNFRSLPATHLGIAHLRQRLSVVLFDQIKAELPRLIEDIDDGISNCQHSLEKLGPARITLDDQVNFLVDLSDDFQSLCAAAIKGDYEHNFFADQSLFDRRLSAMIVNRGMEFAEEIQTDGAQWKVLDVATKKKRYRTRAQAVEEVRKLLKKSRGREVKNPKSTILRVYVLDTNWLMFSYQACQTLFLLARSFENIATLGKLWHASISRMSGMQQRILWSRHCSS